jgi:hypothetical protein
MQFEDTQRLFRSFPPEKFRDRRSLACELIKAAFIGHDLESMFEQLKDAVAYHRLNLNERESFRRFCSDVRFLRRGWHHLSEEERIDMLTGKAIYSTLNKRIRERAPAA